jgi:hypothetical protein
MKIKFSMDTNANSHSRKSETFDLKDLLGYDNDEDAEKEWNEYNEEEKYCMVEDWAWNNGLEVYYEEIV